MMTTNIQSQPMNASILRLEVTLRASAAQTYLIDLRFDDLASAAPVDVATGVAFSFDKEMLLAAGADTVVYGAQLSAMLFAERAVREGWSTAWGYAQRDNSPLHVVLHIADDCPELHALRWELLQHPQSGQFLATDERVVFSRYVTSAAMAPLRRRSFNELRALVLIANPNNLETYRLAPIDVAAESARARVALSALKPQIILGGVADQRSGLATLVDHVRDGYDLIYLVAHGGFRDQEPFVILEGADGLAEPIPAKTLVDVLSQLTRQPTLVVLASCQSAGDESEHGLHALGPRLLRTGIPAVLAMQGNISMIAVTRMLPVFWRELQRADGYLDRAMAVARAATRDLPDWWRPVLFSRLRDGRLWESAPLQPAITAVSTAKAPNPFSRRSRAEEANLIFGREQIIGQVFEELEKGVSVSLVGERQSGKTTVLNQILRLGPERLYLPRESFIYLNMQLIDDERDFFEALCAEMGLETLRGSRLWRALRGRQYIVCLDEIEKMTNASAFSGAEREQLRGLADGGEILRLVIASNAPLERLFPDSEGKTSPLSNICQKIYLPPFTPVQAREYLHTRLEGTGVNFSEAEIEQLIRQSGGHPSKLQRAASELYERYDRI